MKAFKINGATYHPVQKVNGGTQWRCDYPDGQWSAAMVYQSRPTRQNVIDALKELNGHGRPN